MRDEDFRRHLLSVPSIVVVTRILLFLPNAIGKPLTERIDRAIESKNTLGSDSTPISSPSLPRCLCRQLVDPLQPLHLAVARKRVAAEEKVHQTLLRRFLSSS